MTDGSDGVPARQRCRQPPVVTGGLRLSRYPSVRPTTPGRDGWTPTYGNNSTPWGKTTTPTQFQRRTVQFYRNACRKSRRHDTTPKTRDKKKTLTTNDRQLRRRRRRTNEEDKDDDDDPGTTTTTPTTTPWVDRPPLFIRFWGVT